MDTPIMLTPHDLWNIILAVCGGIVAISAAFTVVIKIVDHFKTPDKLQNQRIEVLETEVTDIKLRLKEGDKHFEAQDKWMKEFEDGMKKREKLMIESLQCLISHAIDGNNLDELKSQKHSIDKYLLER